MTTPEEIIQQQQQQIIEAGLAFSAQTSRIEQQQQQILNLERIVLEIQSHHTPPPSVFNSLPPVTSNRIPVIQPPKPSTFDGKNITQARNFILQLEQYFRVVKCESEEIKFNFAASCLRDNAATWWETVCSGVTSFDEFKTKFLSMYSPVVISDTARQMIHTLRQSEDVQKYNTEFLNWICHLDWKEEDKIFVYRQGLKKYIRNRLMNKQKTTLLDDMSNALQIEIEISSQQRYDRNVVIQPGSSGGNNVNYNGRGMGRSFNSTGDRNHNGQGNNNYRGGSQSGNAGPGRGGYQNGGNSGGGNRGSYAGGNGSGAVPMELGNVEQETSHRDSSEVLTADDTNLFLNRLSPERFQEYKAGLCFYCKEKGHIKKDCPKIKAKPNF